MPDKAGAFLRASRIIAEVGGNITRVSYNKAVDVHMLFIEVSADAEQLDTISERLNEIGCMMNDRALFWGASGDLSHPRGIDLDAR